MSRSISGLSKTSGRLQVKYCPGRWLVLDLVTQAGSRGCLWVLWPAWLLKLDDAHR